MTLTTGWEPDLRPDDTVLRRFVHGYADRVAATARAAGGDVIRTERALVGDARSAFLFDNAMVLLQPPEPGTIHQDVAAARETFRGRPWVLLSAWPTEDLGGDGMTLVGHPPLMWRPPGGDPPEHPAHLMIKQVTDEHRLAEFTRTLIDGYPMASATDSAAFHPSMLGTDIELLVGYVDGHPVATGGAAVSADQLEIDWVAVLPQHRGKGYGAALTWAAMTVRPKTPAVLLSSDDGRPVYERLGFVALLRCTMWMGA
jgi:GNAT superfamily N-acetyltransferase